MSCELDDKAYATVTAFLDEREAMYELCNDALNLMAFVETYRDACGEHGPHSGVAMCAQGKMFVALNIMHKKHLRKKILEVQERLLKREAELTRQFASAAPSGRRVGKKKAGR